MQSHLILKQNPNRVQLRLAQFSKMLIFSARQHICLARYMLSPVRPSVRHTGGSHKNGWS